MQSAPLPEEKAQSRQDQILLLAAEGMTDKEIAARLGLSPETVGTYWRRILGKYSAASRTEVVAKVVRLQAEETVSEIAEVNECLKEVTDHLLLVMSGREGDLLEDGVPFHDPMAAGILAQAPFTVAAVDGEGYVTYLSRSRSGSRLAVSDPMEWAVAEGDRERLREALAAAMDDGRDTRVDVVLDGKATPVRVSKGTSEHGPLAIVLLG